MPFVVSILASGRNERIGYGCRGGRDKSMGEGRVRLRVKVGVWAALGTEDTTWWEGTRTALGPGAELPACNHRVALPSVRS